MSYRGWAVLCWAVFYLAIVGVVVNLCSTVIALAAFVIEPSAAHAVIPAVAALCGAMNVVTVAFVKHMLGREVQRADQ